MTSGFNVVISIKAFIYSGILGMIIAISRLRWQMNGIFHHGGSDTMNPNHMSVLRCIVLEDFVTDLAMCLLVFLMCSFEMSIGTAHA